MPLNQFTSPFLLNQTAAALTLPLNALGFPFNISNLLFNQYSSGLNQILNNNSSSAIGEMPNNTNSIDILGIEIPSNRTL